MSLHALVVVDFRVEVPAERRAAFSDEMVKRRWNTIEGFSTTWWARWPQDASLSTVQFEIRQDAWEAAATNMVSALRAVVQVGNADRLEFTVGGP